MEKVWLTEGPADVVERWIPRIVVSKLEIMAALTAPRLRLTRWLVHYLDGASVKVWLAPPATEAEQLKPSNCSRDTSAATGSKRSTI
jgi:hypothetical protein